MPAAACTRGWPCSTRGGRRRACPRWPTSWTTGTPCAPAGELNTRARAEALLAEALPHLPDATFARTKRLLGQAETFTYLGVVQRQLEALPVPAEVRQAAVQQEGLRRRPEALSEPGPR